MTKRLVVIAEYFPPRLGADRRIFELMKRLAYKYDIHFVTLPPSYTLFIRKLDSSQQDRSSILHEGMKGHRLNLPTPLSNLWTKSFILPFAVTWIYLLLSMTRKIAQLKPDIIIINNTSVYTGLLGFICSKIFNKKLLVEYNDLEALYATDLVSAKVNGRVLGILRRLLVSIEDIIVKNGWRVTAITGFIRDYASSRNTRKDIVVIPDGVDTDLFDTARTSGDDIRRKYSVGEGETLCVYAGRIEDCAGVNIILETAKSLIDVNGVKFMVVGEGDSALVRRLSRCANVILTGSVSKENVPEYLAAANIVLVPFPDRIASHSISPLKLFEALAMNRLVIASAVSGIKEVVEDNFDGALVPADPNLWASAIMKHAHKNKASRNNENRYIVLNKYSWNYLAEKFANILEGYVQPGQNKS